MLDRGQELRREARVVDCLRSGDRPVAAIDAAGNQQEQA
jgi:hypothetical protein